MKKKPNSEPPLRVTIHNAPETPETEERLGRLFRLLLRIVRKKETDNHNANAA
jgi:hypothetical protein